MTACLACPEEAVKKGYCHECYIILVSWQARTGQNKFVLHELLRIVKGMYARPGDLHRAIVHLAPRIVDEMLRVQPPPHDHVAWWKWWWSIHPDMVDYVKQQRNRRLKIK